MKTVNQLLEETFLCECHGLNAEETVKALAEFRSFQSPQGDQPAPPHVIAICEALQREAIAEAEENQFRTGLERRTAQN